MEGAAGPSGLDAAAWKRLCSSFKTASADLCTAIASIARKLCTQYVDPKGISAFVACRLIALDKHPGVRPIGIGETIRRIINKAIALALRDEIQDATGALQVCAGQLSGCEAAVHSMHKIFESPETEAAILVDATNAFNCLNRQVPLRNIHQLCPSLSTILTNTYREDIDLFIDGESILSQEGTTQGDPLAMAMYAIAITPLINRLETELVKRTWYADDAAAGGKLVDLKAWWDRLTDLGPDYGYFPNAKKTWLIVKENKLSEATVTFSDTEISITNEGRTQLGGAIGTRAFIEMYAKQKISEWTQEVELLSSIAISQPHAAYTAFTHGLANKWTFLSRTIQDTEEFFKPLEEKIRTCFIPSLTGQPTCNNDVRDLLALPVRLGGLGITNPSKQSASHYCASESITGPLANLILQQSHSYPAETKAEQITGQKNARTHRRRAEQRMANELLEKLPTALQKSMKISTEKGASNWLSTLPIEEHGFALHKGAFRDALCFRYGWQPTHLPAHCVCGKTFNIDHALNCPRGGFPSVRHNEIRDITAEVLTEVCHGVGKEPHLQPVTEELLSHQTANREDGARLDIVAEDFWGRDSTQAFFDVRVFNPLAQTYQNTSMAQFYRRNELEKRRAYDERIREIEHGSFSPLVFSTSGSMGPTATIVYKRIASMISEKNNKPYSKTMHWLRCRLSFSLLRSAIMCLRGCRSALHRPIHHAPPLSTRSTWPAQKAGFQQTSTTSCTVTTYKNNSLS